MSYIFIDVDEARRCAALIDTHADLFGELIVDASDPTARRLEEFCRKLYALSADLSNVTESYAAADEKLKNLHLMTNDQRSAAYGKG